MPKFNIELQELFGIFKTNLIDNFLKGLSYFLEHTKTNSLEKLFNGVSS